MKNIDTILTGRTADKKQYSTLMDSSLLIYNREAHDKTMCADVGEINFMVSIKSIINSNHDREKLCQLIKSSYGSLFNKEFIEEIRCLSKEDFISVCIYHPLEDTFSGLEYYILKHLIDSHIEKFIEDMRSGDINKIIKLCVSKDNLIVKVFPAKSKDDNQVSYTISLLYLVLLHLYKHLYQDKTICSVIKELFLRVTPIVTKVAYTVKINADDSYSWFTQLQQLDSCYKFFDITKSKKQVRFIFRPKEHYLTSTLYYPVINLTPSDTNYKARFIKCTYTLDKNDKITCKTTIVGKDMVDSVFSTKMDKEDEPASIYSSLSDDEIIYLAQYSILKRMLSFTQQHEQLKAATRLGATKLVEQGKYKICNIDKPKTISILARTNTIKHVFKGVETLEQDDKLISIIKKELEKLGQKNSQVDYIITILELLNKDKNAINETLAPLDDRTAEKIRKVINKMKKVKLTPGFTLNKFYKGF